MAPSVRKSCLAATGLAVVGFCTMVVGVTEHPDMVMESRAHTIRVVILNSVIIRHQVLLALKLGKFLQHLVRCCDSLAVDFVSTLRLYHADQLLNHVDIRGLDVAL